MRDLLLSCNYPAARIDKPIKDLMPSPEWHLICIPLNAEHVNHELLETGVISEVWQTYWVDTGAPVESDSDYWSRDGVLGYVLIPGKIVVFPGENEQGWEDRLDDISEIEESGSSADESFWMPVDQFNLIPEGDRRLKFEMKDCEEYPQYDPDEPISDLLERLIEEESGSPTWC